MLFINKNKELGPFRPMLCEWEFAKTCYIIFNQAQRSLMFEMITWFPMIIQQQNKLAYKNNIHG